VAEIRRGDDFVVEVGYAAEAAQPAFAAFAVSGVADTAAALANGTVMGAPSVRVQLRVGHDGVAEVVAAEVVLGEPGADEHADVAEGDSGAAPEPTGRSVNATDAAAVKACCFPHSWPVN
jgi:hypothetical protein